MVQLATNTVLSHALEPDRNMPGFAQKGVGQAVELMNREVCTHAHEWRLGVGRAGGLFQSRVRAYQEEKHNPQSSFREHCSDVCSGKPQADSPLHSGEGSVGDLAPFRHSHSRVEHRL